MFRFFHIWSLHDFYHEGLLDFVTGIISIKCQDHNFFPFTFLIQIFMCWTISASLWSGLLDHVGWSFWCVLGFSLWVFYWIYLLPLSWEKLVKNSLSFFSLCMAWVSDGLCPHNMNFRVFRLFLFCWLISGV